MSDPTHQLPPPRDATPPAAFVDHDSNHDAHGHDEGHGEKRVELPPMPTGVAIAMAAAFVLILAGLFVAGWIPNHKRNEEIEKRAAERTSDKPIVSVVAPKQQLKQPPLELPGTARAFQSTAILPRASGYLGKLNVDIGDKAKAGDVLAEIETPELDAQLATARATLEQGRANATRFESDLELAANTLKRYQGLAESGGVTQQQIDEKKSAYEQAKSAEVGSAATIRGAEAEVQRLEALQGFKRVTAPFAGTITQRGYDVGALVNATNTAKPLFQLDQTDTIRVFVDVPQSYAAQIRVGNPAQFVTRADPNNPFVGTIARTAGAIDEQSRTLRVEADFPNADGRLLPGTYGQLRYDVSRPDERPTLLVPTSALVFDSKGMRVVTIDAENKASFKTITVGRDFGTEIEVVTGLKGDERIVANPSERVVDGTTVELAKNNDEKSASGNATAQATQQQPTGPAPASPDMTSNATAATQPVEKQAAAR